MEQQFSSRQRASRFTELSTLDFDVLVVGGGITGAGIALDAAARGLRVALVDMQDFAGGTSGRSTKLIHGGLRYLKQLEFGLVAEVGQERSLLHQLAPHLTQPEPMLLPVRKGDAMGPLLVRVGMFLYERLARVLPAERHRYFGAAQALEREPLLKAEGLRGGALFYEYRTDDARLTLEIMKQAAKHGARVVNYVEVKSFTYTKGRVSGAVLHDRLRDTTCTVKCRYVVNAAGPWVDRIDHLDQLTTSRLTITKGVHLVVDRSRLPVRQAVYFEAGDGRMLFVIPRANKTYFGTTDTFYTDTNLQEPHISTDDRDYLLQSINTYFKVSLSPGDLESAWAGLRPLIAKPGKQAGEISRKDEIFVSSTGLITIAGGKLTGYRKMALRVMEVLAAAFQRTEGLTLPPSSTHRIALTEAKLPGSFADFLKQAVAEGIELGLDALQAEKLAYCYGTAAHTIYQYVRDLRSGVRPPAASGLPDVLYAQLLHAVGDEMCCTPADFFIRRTAMAYFDVQLTEQWADAVREELKQLISPVPTVLHDELAAFLEHLRQLRVP